MSFTSKLPSGHKISKLRTADLLKLLQDDARVKGTIPTDVNARREWVSALHWADSNKPLLQTDLQALPASGRDLLCSILGVVGRASQSMYGSILDAIKADSSGPSEPASFLDFLVKDNADFVNDLRGMSSKRIDGILTDLPACFSSGASTVAERRERCAMHAWLTSVNGPDDFSALPSSLRGSIFSAFGVPAATDDVRAGMVLLLSGRKSVTTRQNFGAGGGAGGGAAGGSAAPAPSPGSTAAPSTPAAGGSVAGGALSLVPVPPHGPVKLGTSSLWDNPAAIDYGSFTPGTPGRIELDRLIPKYMSLKKSWLSLVTSDDLKLYRSASKLTQDQAEAASYATHFSTWPWAQRLTVDPTQAFKADRQGRMLMNALRFDTDVFSDWGEQMARTYRNQDLERVHLGIQSALQSGDTSQLLLVYGDLRNFASQALSAEENNVAALFTRFPIPLFAEMHAGRRTQAQSVSFFFDSVSKRISTESKKVSGNDEASILVGFYISFFNSFKSGDVTADEASAMVKLGQSFTSLSAGQGAGAAVGTMSRPSMASARSSPAVLSVVSTAATPAGAGRGQGGKSPDGAGPRYRTGRSLPSSVSIIGPHLGVAGPTFKCHQCNEVGHWKGECPIFWGSKGKPLPGWKADGSKIKKAWDGENPTKATFKAWVQFIQDNFPDNGEAAGVEGAPTFDDYVDRAKKGAGP